MFIITNNQEIRISHGDDSGKFPILLNKGTKLEPDYYTITDPTYVGGKTSKAFEILLDKATFLEKCPGTGLYSFYYLEGKWYLFDNEVELIDYGIVCTGTLKDEDAFSIINVAAGEDWVRFYIIEVNQPFKDWIVRKTFYRTGVIISEYDGQIPIRETDESIIDADGNFLLHLSKEDTGYLKPGEYNFMVQASITDKQTGKANVSTVTNRLPFYIIDDNFNRRWE